MEPVYDRVARDLEAVRASVTPLKTGDHGPVTWWSAEQLRTWSNRPWNKDGEAASARASRQRRHRGEVPRLRRAVALGRPAHREHRRIPGFPRRVGADVETANGAAAAGPHPGRRRRRRRARSSTPTRSASARSVRSPSPTPECSVPACIRMVASDAGYLRAAGAPAGGPEVELVPEHIEVSAAVDARFVGEADRGARRSVCVHGGTQRPAAGRPDRVR